MPLRVLIVAPRLDQEGLAYALRRRRSVEVVGAVATARDAVAECRRLRPEIVLVDTVGADSKDVIRTIRASVEGAKILILAANETDDELVALAEVGAEGFVTRDQSFDELIAALEHIGRGEASCPPRLAAAFIRRVTILAAANDALDPRRLRGPRPHTVGTCRGSSGILNAAERLRPN